MNNYDFSSLHDKEFEEFCRDLLNAEFNMDLQSFKPGKDKGIDLRYASPKNENEIVVQVKHYVKTGFGGLLSKLENKELEKIQKLKPKKYFLVTSVPLNPQDKEKIKTALSPFIETTNEIIGQEDLIKYLSKHEQIERKYYKLWLTSTSVLQTIINRSFYSKSKFYEEKIKKDISLYVKSKNYETALSMLQENKFLLISGQPGVGKTSLAKSIAFEFMARGADLFYIDQELKEAESVMSDDPKVKQIFLLDDFLGSNYYEILNPKSSHSSIISFIERVMQNQNKYCILTTRTNILYKSYFSSENLRRSSINVSKLELEIKDYSRLDKAKILYSHFFHYNLSETLLQKIYEEKRYWGIIQHQNYYPRLVEFFTKPNNFKEIKTSDKYIDFVFRTLNNPDEVWLHAFNEQIEEEDRFLVITQFSFGREINLEILSTAFNAKLDFEIKNHGFIKKQDSFNSSMKRLLDGFLASKRIEENAYIQFINPSINDFLINYFLYSQEERFKLVSSTVYYTQFKRIVALYKHIKEKGTRIKPEELNVLIEKIDSLEHSLGFLDLEFKVAYFGKVLDTKMEADEKNIRIALLYCEILSFDNSLHNLVDGLIFKYLNSIDLLQMNSENDALLLELLQYYFHEGTTYTFLKNNLFELSDKIINRSGNVSTIKKLKELYFQYDTNFDEYLKDPERKENYKTKAEENIGGYLSDFTSDLKSSILSKDDLDKAMKQVEEEFNSLTNELDVLMDYDFYNYLEKDKIEELMVDNSTNDEDSSFDDWKESQMNNTIEKGEIDSLFSKT